MTATRFPELAYDCFGPDLWRIVDLTTGQCIGPHYRTRVELLTDLHRFAVQFGCAS